MIVGVKIHIRILYIYVYSAYTSYWDAQCLKILVALALGGSPRVATP